MDENCDLCFHPWRDHGPDGCTWTLGSMLRCRCTHKTSPLWETLQMRELTGHKVNGVNDGLTVTVLDGPGPGGANHLYRLEWDDKKWGPDPTSMHQMIEVHFQNGPIREVGTNGVTHEALLAILIDRLEGFQRGPYNCHANALALSHLQAAQQELLERTKERAKRGVEGTHQP